MDDMNGAFIRLGDYILVLAKVARTDIDLDLIVNIPGDVPVATPIRLTEVLIDDL